ncbi:MAG TPA: hypothetical protein VGM88_31230 [Kofleriaceae bacterium]|jgi:ElaB/YqjD/DUF883 family membrane-anchored ribosome-binding protein
MSDQRPPEVQLEDAERRIEESKAALEQRLHRLERDAERAKERVVAVERAVDVRWRIKAHPAQAVIAAAAAGFVLGLVRRSRG